MDTSMTIAVPTRQSALAVNIPNKLGVIQGSYAYWRRMLLVWQKSWISTCFAYILDPMVFLFAFGYGLGTAFESMGGLPYFAFVVPGMMGLGLLYNSFVECSYAAFFRIEVQRTYHAVLATPMTLGHIVIGELLWSATKATACVVCVMLAGAFFGGVLSGWLALLAIPVAFLTAMAIAAMALLLTSFCKHMDNLNFAWPLIVSPMLLFCGTFVDVTHFPDWVQTLSMVLPLRHGVDIMRMFTSGHIGAPESIAASLGYLVLLTAVFGVAAYWKLRLRIYT